ncbi:alpha/beta hydrolase family protein [Bacillus kexueae]|uniref:alpha/beta hydrolase family protein n=1 Tax=Aeribacillus kexueae TaxID=2078952 RepID=UPI001FAE935F|nr:prolyl oligopeptidase family serine peptidase [Bacillus kexueae]
MKNGEVIAKQPYPSPHPAIRLFIVTYWSGGLKVKGLLAEPIQRGCYEGFLYLRGGIKNVGMVRPSRIVQFASQGFVVMAPFYRGNQGGEGNEDFGGEDREDAFSALNLLRNLPNVQSNRIHVFGFSRGGVMALLTAIHDPSICSVVTWGGVSDMILTYEERKDLRRMMKRVIGGTPTKFPERYRWRTPLYEIDKVLCPILIIHGAKDKNVSIEHAYRLENKMKELNKQIEVIYFEEFDHYFPPMVNQQMVRYLCSWMKEQNIDGTTTTL